MSRIMAKTPGYVVAGATQAPEAHVTVEGVGGGSGLVAIKPMVVGDEAVLIEVTQIAGTRVPEHNHPDHESVIYLVKGRMTLWINGLQSAVKTGDAWIHPRGVPHSSEALEDCTFVEVKTPPRKTWA